MKTIMTVFLALVTFQALAQPGEDFSDVEIVPHQLADNLYYLSGQGGNIAMAVGDDGVYLVDDQFAPLSEKILATVASITDQQVRFVLNTHYHGDHVGGNANLAKKGVVVVAHDNVRTQLASGFRGDDLQTVLSREQRQALPVITYTSNVSFHLNNEEIFAFHIQPAHTNGDSFVYFRNANVIHTGDTFRTTGYPVVDGNANGSFHGIVAAYEMLLDISDENTRFLPGHGEVSGQQEIRKQLDMFQTIRDRVKQGITEGHSLEQLQGAGLTAEYDADWAGGRVKGPDLVAVIYSELLNMQ